MEADLLIDGVASGIGCCTPLIEIMVNKFLANSCGRMTLIISKIFGIIFDLIALYQYSTATVTENTLEVNGQPVSFNKYQLLAMFMCAIFVMDRILVLLILCCYGYKPENNKNYVEYKHRLINIDKKFESEYGLTSLWYGSLFSFPDYAAKLWSINEDSICGAIGFFYCVIIFVEIPFAMSISMWSWLLISDGSDLGIGFIAIVSIILLTIGLCQHTMNIATTLRAKIRRKGMKKSQNNHQESNPQQVELQIQMQQSDNPSQQTYESPKQIQQGVYIDDSESVGCCWDCCASVTYGCCMCCCCVTCILVGTSSISVFIGTIMNASE